MSPTKPLIAITGINGFIATAAVLHFLANGWHVRGSVRTAAQAEKLKTLPAYAKYIASGELDIIVLGDLVKDDFKELVEGADAVASMAAPGFMTDDPVSFKWEHIKGPTIDPILKILKYAEESSTIKSVIILSSGVTSVVGRQDSPGKVYTEDDWAPFTEEFCQTLDPVTNPMATFIWYTTAKKLAEEAVLDYIENKKPSFSVTIFCPSMVTGPAHFIPSIDAIKDLPGGSSKDFVSLLSGKDQPLPAQISWSFVDVRDVAESFYAAVTKHVSGKFFISGREFTWQEFVDKLRAFRPDLDAYIAAGEPGKEVIGEWSVDGGKSQKELGLKYRTTEETLKDTLEFYEGLGLFKEAPIGAKKA
ncbi:hypothetical protein I350_03852 [Cryptococcus amylolentus CBS 6273]|uniref:NAD-dependent epimerase/dehydratase domain-containing protein n=1 Tax=Cryptococcus amylolentus CBS 6273 TaxID=1296118 RepID=A0A1E3K7Q9_9TREE|nr:hypothetical protein I350_03852 [Cryptococcus amylolentus CBS 6273]